jgi:hypothetical protein
MTAEGDSRRLKRERYHEWLRRRWLARASEAAAKRACVGTRKPLENKAQKKSRKPIDPFGR